MPRFTFTLSSQSKVDNASFQKQRKEALHQYITRIITNKKQTVIRINSMPVNAHILVGFATDVTFLQRFDLPNNLKYVFDSDDVSES